MFKEIYRFLPVILVTWMARKYSSIHPGPSGWRWHQPWRDVLILCQEDYDTFNRKQWLENLERKKQHYQALADQMAAKIRELQDSEREEDDDDGEEISGGADESGSDREDRRAAAPLRKPAAPCKRRNADRSVD